MHRHEQDERFIFVMAALGEASNQGPGEFKIRIYAEALKEKSIDEIEHAAWGLIRSRTLASFPKVGELLEFIGGGKSDDLAVIALDKVEKAMRTHGMYRSLVFDDPLIHATIYSMGGWPKICGMTQDEWKWQRKDFEKIYKAFCTSNPETPPRLSGIVEKEGGEFSIAYAGDKQKALEWSGRVVNKKALNSKFGGIVKDLAMPDVDIDPECMEFNGVMPCEPPKQGKKQGEQPPF